MNVNACRNCGNPNVQVFKHHRFRKFIGFMVVCPNCGLQTKDFKRLTDAKLSWNNPLYVTKETNK